MAKLIAQGAEAKIYETSKGIIKDRVKKSYRLPEIDQKLRRTRTRVEARLIRMADRAGVSVPKILEVDDRKMKLEIEKIEGSKVRDVLVPDLCKQIGKELLKLHTANIVHGDLTTSNMILRGSDVILIDFGLAQYSEKVEDKAVDIHLFKECLKSKHFDIWLSCWKQFLSSYKSKDVLERLKKVELRGKYKH